MYSDKANKTSRWLIIWALYQYGFPVRLSAARWWFPNWIWCVWKTDRELCVYMCACVWIWRCFYVISPYISIKVHLFAAFPNASLGLERTASLWLRECFLCTAADRLKSNWKLCVSPYQISKGQVQKLHRHPHKLMNALNICPNCLQWSVEKRRLAVYPIAAQCVSDGCHGTVCDVMRSVWEGWTLYKCGKSLISHRWC